MPGRKLSVETRREDILRAAYDVAARHGLESLTLRAVAERADVSHGTVLFHFTRRDELVAALLDRVIYATVVLRVPFVVENVTRPSERLRDLLRAEMERLATEVRHFRLLLEYWALGVRRVKIRKRISAALEAYRAGWKTLTDPVVNAELESRSQNRGSHAAVPLATADGVAAVAVSLVQGCALQAVIDPKGFDIQQHFYAVARMLDGFGLQGSAATRGAARAARV